MVPNCAKHLKCNFEVFTTLIIRERIHSTNTKKQQAFGFTYAALNNIKYSRFPKAELTFTGYLKKLCSGVLFNA